MIDAFVGGFLAGIIGYLVVSGFQELRLWRLSVAIKAIREAMLTGVRRQAANKRWDTEEEMAELLAATKKNKFGVNDPEPDDKWSGIIKRG